MRDEHKTKEQLIDELKELRQHIIDLEKLKTERKHAAELLRESEDKYHRAEEVLRASEEKYRHLIGNIKEVIFALDKDSIITYVSSIVEKIAGYKSSELINRPFSSFVHEQDLQRVRDDHAKIIAGKSLTSEYRIATKSGETRWLSVFCRPIFVGSSVVGIEGVLSDVTEQKHVEEALRQSEDYYRLLSDDAESGIFIYYDKRFVFINREFQDITGYTRDELLEIEVPDLIISEDRTIMEHRIDARRKGETVPVEFTVRIRRKNGEIALIVCREHSSPIMFEDKRAVLSHCFDITKYRWALRAEPEMDAITESKRALDALRDSQRRFKDIAESALEWIWEVDASGRYIYASPVVEKILGYKSDEVLGKHFYDFFHPEDHEVKRAALTTFAAHRPFREFINRNIHSSGRTVWLSTSGVPIRDEKGTFLGYRGVDIDITERKRAEDALRREKERAQRYLDVAGVMLCVIGSDETVIMINKKGCELLGYSEADVVGKNWFDNFIPSSIREDIRARFRRLMSGDKEPDMYFENPIVRSDGSERLILWHNTILTDEMDTIIGTLSSGEDITERKHAEEALRESEEKFRLTFENAKDAIVWVDHASGLIINCNKAAELLLEKTREDVVGAPRTSLHPPDKVEHYDSVFRKHLEQNGVVDEEAAIITKSGVVKPVHITASVTTIGEKSIIQEIIRDITERKQAEEELRVRATTDALTGVLNRGSGLLLFGKQLQIAKRNNSKVSICYLDVNGLKDINDTYGHQEGDEALKFVGKLLKETLRKVDIICRLGGDEFLLILPQCPLEKENVVWERIFQKVESFNAARIKPYKISLSRGFAEYNPHDEQFVDQLIASADREMYRFKHSVSNN